MVILKWTGIYVALFFSYRALWVHLCDFTGAALRDFQFKELFFKKS